MLVVPSLSVQRSGDGPCAGYELLIAERDGGNILVYDGDSVDVLVSGLNKPTRYAGTKPNVVQRSGTDIGFPVWIKWGPTLSLSAKDMPFRG